MASPPVSIQNPQSFSSILNTFQNADNDKHVRFQGAKGLYTSQGGSLTAIKAFFGFDSAMKAREQKRADAFNNMRQAIDTEYGAGTADKLFKHMALEGRDLSKGVTVGDLQTMGNLLTTTEHERQRAAVGYDIVPELDRPGLDAEYEAEIFKPANAGRLANELPATMGMNSPSIDRQKLAAALLPLLQKNPVVKAEIEQAVRDAYKEAALVDIPQSLNIAPQALILPRLERQFSEILGRTPPGTLQDLQDAVRLNANKPALATKIAQDTIAKMGLNSPSMDMAALQNAIVNVLNTAPNNQNMIEGAVKSAYVTAALIDLPAAMNINPTSLGMISLEKHCRDVFGAGSTAGEAEIRAAITQNVQMMAQSTKFISDKLLEFKIPNVGFDQRILADLITDMTRRQMSTDEDNFRVAISRATILTASKAGDFEGILAGSKSLIGNYSKMAVDLAARGGSPLGTFMRGSEGREMVEALAPHLAPPAQRMLTAALSLPVPPDAAFTSNDIGDLASGRTTPNQTFGVTMSAQAKANAIEADTVRYLDGGLTAIFGGKDVQSIQRTVASLPDEVCMILATLHDEGERVGSQRDAGFGAVLGSNIMNNAFFLRYINPTIVTMAASLPSDDPKKSALSALSIMTQSILNGSPPKSVGPASLGLYNNWKDVGQMFNDAVLLRGRALLAS